MHTFVTPLIAIAALSLAPEGQAQTAPTRPAKATSKKSPSQSSQPSQDSVQETRKRFAAKVGKAHRPEGGKPLQGFRADLEVGTKGAAKNIDIKLNVTYSDRVLARDKTEKAMIKYRVNEGSEPKTRAYDGRREWMMIGGQSNYLTGSDYVEDRRTLQSHLRLCKQVLRLLSPGEVLAALKSNSPVGERPIPYGRDKSNYLFLSGRHSNFPLFSDPKTGIAQGAALLEAWIDPATHRLAAVRVFPINNKGKASDRGEFVLLGKPAKVQGLLLPQVLKSYPVIKGKLHTSHTMVTIESFMPNPKVTRKDFERPRK